MDQALETIPQPFWMANPLWAAQADWLPAGSSSQRPHPCSLEPKMARTAPFYLLSLQSLLLKKKRASLMSRVVISAGGRRKGAPPEMARRRENRQRRLRHKQCASQATNQNAFLIQPGLSGHELSNLPTMPRNRYPRPSGLVMNSTAQNERDTPHIWLFFLESR